MPQWAGKWEGGRFYLDEAGKPVYFIERRGRSVKLETHDEEIAKGMLGLYLENPAHFVKQRKAARSEPDEPEAVFITAERINLYMQSIRHCVEDHKNARRSYLLAWAEKGLDLAHVDKRTLRAKLAEWDGGHRGRVEALNAFCNFLVEEEDLNHWRRFVNPFDPKKTRAERRIHTLEELNAKYKSLGEGRIRDVFYLRASTGMHHTEISQIRKVKIYPEYLPDDGAGLRLVNDHAEIKGVLQVKHKNGDRHRCTLDQAGLDAVLRLRDVDVPNRVTMWKKLSPMTPSNLRHTFATRIGEVGVIVSYTEGGLPRSIVAQLMGHKAGSTMLAERYENMQIPPLAKLPLDI